MPATAFTVCTSPDGVAGNQIYNTTHNVMQYCNGTVWKNMGVSSVGTIADGDKGDITVSSSGTACREAFARGAA